MVANFSDYKDYDTYLEAARQILQRRQDVVFLAVGEGKNLDRHRHWACKRGLDGIQLLGLPRPGLRIPRILDPQAWLL